MSVRDGYRYFLKMGTRWKDNDVYGHVNNVVYYSFFDTAINQYLIASGGLDIRGGAVMGVCAESHCRFLGELAFPEDVEAGLRVEHLGNSSVRYGVGLFRAGAAEAAAEGWFVHVFVDRISRRPVAIPAVLRGCLERLAVSAVDR